MTSLYDLPECIIINIYVELSNQQDYNSELRNTCKYFKKCYENYMLMKTNWIK